MFVLYLQNSFCKPFQISQIEYSAGFSIILNLSGSKKEYVFFIYRCICVVHCLHLCIYRSFGLRIFFIHSFLVFFLVYSIHFFTLLLTDHLLFIYLQYLLYVSSIHSSRYFGLSFVLLLGFSIGLSIYLLGVDFLMYCFLLIYLMFVLYLQNFFCKPFQISQIEYSDGASIILNLSGSKKEYVFFIYRCICVVHCLHLCIYRSFGLRIFFIHSFLVYFFGLFHPFLYFVIYRPFTFHLFTVSTLCLVHSFF